MENGSWQTGATQQLIKGTPEWIAERDRILLEWERSKNTLEVAKENEMNLRKQFVKFAFDADKLTGTERIDLNNGWQAKAVKKINYKFVAPDENTKVNDAIDAALTEIERISPEAQFLADRLVKWSADLSLGEYNKLHETELGRKVKVIIDKVIESSEGSPTLELIEPKTKK